MPPRDSAWASSSWLENRRPESIWAMVVRRRVRDMALRGSLRWIARPVFSFGPAGPEAVRAE
jgi:hypothetical protein